MDSMWDNTPLVLLGIFLAGVLGFALMTAGF